MATGMVITVVEKVIAQLCSQELKEMCTMFNYESQLDGLNTTVLTIKSVLLDAQSKHQELTNSGRDYIEKLKYAAYDVDDLLDEFNTMVQKEKYKKGGKIFKKLNNSQNVGGFCLLNMLPQIIFGPLSVVSSDNYTALTLQAQMRYKLLRSVVEVASREHRGTYTGL